MKWPQLTQLKDRVSTAFSGTALFAIGPTDKVVLCSVQVYMYVVTLLTLREVPEVWYYTPLLATFLVIEKS